MIRIGHARDIHRLEVNGRPFVLGGINNFQNTPLET